MSLINLLLTWIRYDNLENNIDVNANIIKVRIKLDQQTTVTIKIVTL